MLKTKIKRKKILLFIIGCSGCLETIKSGKFNVTVKRNGKPDRSEIKRIFAKPEMQVAEKCPLCKSKKLRPIVFL